MTNSFPLSENPVEEYLDGFVLTRQAFDTKQGIQVVLWVKTLEGAKKLIIDGEQALFFVSQADKERALSFVSEENIALAKCADLELTTFKHQKVTALYFHQLRDFYQARECLKEHKITLYEDDIRPEERYLMERFITASGRFAISDASHSHFTKIAKSKTLSDHHLLTDVILSTVSLDIECSPKGDLYSIGLQSLANEGEDFELVFMIGDDSVKSSNTLSDADVEHIKTKVTWCENERHLLVEFLEWLVNYDPDIIIGWNVVQFDLNLLQKRCDLYNIPFTLGRQNGIPRWRKNASSEQRFIDIPGRVVLDGIDVLKTATYNFASFSLENVSNELLGMSKKVEDVDNRLQEIIDNFHHDKLALAEYNLQDCRLVSLIFEKAQLLSFAMLRAQLTGLSLDRTGGSVAAFTNLYLPKLHRGGFIAPNLGDGMKGLVSPGGYVMDSIPGLYKNVLVLDFKSLYPSIIRTFNIDPMGMVKGLECPEQSIEGFDGAYFSRTEHFLPDIIQELWQERDIAKKEQNAALSQAIKIIMNSFYGVLGSTGCRFFDPRLSGSITKRGHELLKTTKQWIEDKGWQVIYGDTDSIFVHLGAEANGEQHSAQRCREIGHELAEFINNSWRDNLAERFTIESALEMEFETHFSQFFMPTIRGLDVGTKKRYAGLVVSGSEEKMVFKGLETVRTDWTELAKGFQQELYRRVFHNEPVEDFVLETVERTRNGEMDAQLIYRKRIRRKLEHYVKNVPPHIKAARLADEQNEANGKRLKFQNRGWIEYVLTTAGPQAIGYQNAPLDYQLYIDRQLKSVADAILPFVGTSFDQITDQQMTLF